MRIFLISTIFTLALALITASYSLEAKEQVSKVGEGQTRIEVDSASNVVRIMIEGKEILAIDKDGIHVKGDITYSGGIIDSNNAAQ